MRLAPLKTSFFVRAIRGEVRLWKVFYFYLIFFQLPVSAVLGEVSLRLMTHPERPLLIMAMIAVSLAQFYIWACIWRCAFNCEWRGWGYLARAGVLYLVYHYAISYRLLDTLNLNI